MERAKEDIPDLRSMLGQLHVSSVSKQIQLKKWKMWTYSSLLVDIWYMVTQCLLHRNVFFKKYFCPMVFHFIRETCFKFHSEGPCFGGPTSTAFTSNLKFRKLIDILWSFPCAVLERVWPLLRVTPQTTPRVKPCKNADRGMLQQLFCLLC